MSSHTDAPRRRRNSSNGAGTRGKPQPFSAIKRLVEDDTISRVPLDQYQAKVKDVYGGPQGAILATASMLSLHTPLTERLFRSRRFSLAGMKTILDVGSGAGQLAQHLLKYADPGTQIYCTDLSQPMLRRARRRLKGGSPTFVTADLTALPFPNDSFDGVTCGYVLEHLPDPQLGLAELARVMRPGARMFLLTTEDTIYGAWTSRFWCCRTYNRKELMRQCESLGLRWQRELWLTRVHQAVRLGGICVEIEKP